MINNSIFRKIADSGKFINRFNKTISFNSFENLLSVNNYFFLLNRKNYATNNNSSSEQLNCKDQSESKNTYTNSCSIKNEMEFLKLSSDFLEGLYEKIEGLELDNVEADFAEGVLKVSFLVSKQSYVLNIQRPNLQIWFSSPISGPQRYEYNKSNKSWENIRTNRSMIHVLEEEFRWILVKSYGLLDKKINLSN